MLSFFNKSIVLMLAVAVGLSAGPSAAWAKKGGGGGSPGGSRGGGGGGFQGGSFRGGGGMSAARMGGGSRGNFSAPRVSSGSRGNFSAPRISSGSRGNFSAPRVSSGSRGNFSAPRVSSGSRGNVAAPRVSSEARNFAASRNTGNWQRNFSASPRASVSPRNFNGAQFHRGSNFKPSPKFSGNDRVANLNINRGNAFRDSGAIHRGSTGNWGSSAYHRGKFTAGKHYHPVNPHAWSHHANWGHAGKNRNYGYSGKNWNNWHAGNNWNHGHGWKGHSYWRGSHHYPRYWYPFVTAALGYPFWWSAGPYYGGYYSGNSYWNAYPYAEYYYGTDYGYQPTANISTTVVSSDPYPANYEQPLPASEEPVSVSVDPGTVNEDEWGAQYVTSARDAFRQGSYTDALRLASHATIEMPQNAKPHELASLAYFALKDYRGANLEAHAALSLADAADWPTLYAHYGDLPTYQKQLDALVNYVREHPEAVDARFVLAYHNLMMGHNEAAKEQFDRVLAKIPQDQLAAGLLKKLGGTPPPAAAPPTPANPGIEVPPQPAESQSPTVAPQTF